MTTGYACPVCDDPQADIGHLANHLAFTAMLRDEAHADWLNEHVPGWEQYDEAELTTALEERTDLLEERDYPQVFEDTTGDGDTAGRDDPTERSGALFDDGSGHGHDHQHAGHGHDAGQQSAGLPEGADAEALPGDEIPQEEREAIMEEAREMTRRLRGEAAADGDGDDEAPDEPSTTDDE